MALLRTPHGEVAERVEHAAALGSVLADPERHFRFPARLGPWSEKARDELAREAALEDSPEVTAQSALYRETRERLRALGWQFADGAMQLGDHRGEKERDESRRFGLEMAKRHEPRLEEILRACIAARSR